MNSAQFFWIETCVFFGLGALFWWIERRWPVRRMNVRREFRWDLTGALILLLFVGLARQTVYSVFSGLGVEQGLSQSFGWVHHWPSLFKVAAAFIVSDFFMYWIHRGMHEVPVLWRVHRWHHTIEELYWFSGLRSSFGHVFLFAVSQVFCAFFLFRLSAIEAGIAFGIGVFCQFYTHANWRFEFGPFKRFIVTPAFHRLHHLDGPEQRRNFGVTLSLWDPIFGTFQDPRRTDLDRPLGLGTEKINFKDRRAVARAMWGV